VSLDLLSYSGGKMHFKRIKAPESGRSMVEMLGVLAVIGVLTIGGVSGFRYALDSIHANTIVSEVQLRMLALSRAGASMNRETSEKTLKRFWKTSAGDYILDNKFQIALTQPDGEGPVLDISNLSAGICNRLKSKSDVPMTINHVAVADATCSGDNNSVQFTSALVNLDPEYSTSTGTSTGGGNESSGGGSWVSSGTGGSGVSSNTGGNISSTGGEDASSGTGSEVSSTGEETSSSTDSSISSGTIQCTTDADCPPSEPGTAWHCIEGVCQAAVTGWTCHSDSDCEEWEMCDVICKPAPGRCNTDDNCEQWRTNGCDPIMGCDGMHNCIPKACGLPDGFSQDDSLSCDVRNKYGAKDKNPCIGNVSMLCDPYCYCGDNYRWAVVQNPEACDSQQRCEGAGGYWY